MVNNKLKQLIQFTTLLASVLSMLLGVAVIIGWFSHEIVLIQVLPGFVPMQFNTALGFIFAGLSLFFVCKDKPKQALWSSAITILIGTLSGIQYLAVIDLHIDQLFMDHYITVKTSHPGRMAPNTALSFLFTGIGLYVIASAKDLSQRNWVLGWMGSIVLGLGLMAVFGYVFNLPTAYGWLAYTRMAMHTAVGFSLLGIGMISMVSLNTSSEKVKMDSSFYWKPILAVIFTLLFSFFLSSALDVNYLNQDSLHKTRLTLDLASDIVLFFGLMMGGLLGLTLWINQRLKIRAIEAESMSVQLSQEEAALLASEQRYQRAIEGTNDGLWEWNIETGDNYFSPRWAEILGYELSELEPVLGTFTDLIHPEDKSRIEDSIKLHLEKEVPFSIEFRMRNKNNNYIWIHSKGRASRDNNGQPTIMAGSITDITDRKAVQDLLLKNERKLAITLDSIGDAVIATDADGNVTRMNAVAEKLTGWCFSEKAGFPLKSVFSIINATTRKPIDNPVDIVVSTGNTVYLSNHTTLLSRDGSEYQIADSAAPIKNNEDQIIGMVLVFNDVTEAYQLREKAKSIQQQLQELLDDMQTMVAITTPDGKVSFANNQSLKTSAIELDDVMNKPIWETPWFNYDEDVQAFIKKECNKAMTGNSILHDIQIAVPDGLLWVSYSIHPVFDSEGKVKQFVHEARDISARKKIEDENRDSQQHLKLYREQAALAVVEWDTESHIVDWNPAAEKMFGFSLEEIKGRDFAEFMIPEQSREDAHKVCQEIFDESGGSRSINENLTKDGRIILCEWHNTTLVDASGTVIGAASLVLDITAEHQAQSALEAKELEQREILNSMIEAVITIDETGYIISYNKTAENLFGYTLDEVKGQNVNGLMPEPFAKNHDGYLQRYLSTGEGRIIGCGREVLGQKKNGQIFPMRLSVAELSTDKNGKRYFIGTCQDLTQIQQQEELLRRTHKMEALGKLTGGIAHDFNNMLGVIMGYTDLLKKKIENQPKLEKYANQIHLAGKRGAKLTQQLLSFSRKQSLQPTKLNLNTLLLEQQDMLQKTLTVKIKLLMELGEKIWPIWVDSSELENAVFNMSINAMHAMAEKQSGARLTIQTCNRNLSRMDAMTLGLEQGDYVQLSLTDTGTGVDESIKEKIFDPFFTTKGEFGTGLGLSQVFGFAERAGGQIMVYSEPDHGSKFLIYFPRYEKEESKPAKKTKQLQVDFSGDEKILIVDDEKALLELTAEILTTQGYQTFSAEDGIEALEILAKEDIDLILSDVIMPEMDGYQLAATVKEKYPNIKIQLASGFTDERHVGMTDESLYSELLYKPYEANTMLERIRVLLDNK